MGKTTSEKWNDISCNLQINEVEMLAHVIKLKLLQIFWLKFSSALKEELPVFTLAFTRDICFVQLLQFV